MRDAKSHEIIRPPNILRAKMGKARGKTRSAALAQADAALADLRGAYRDWARADLDQIVACYQTLISESDHAAALERMRHFATELVSQGTSVGYPLMSGIAKSLHRFAGDLDSADRDGRAVIKAHIQAMDAVLRNELTGDGGAVGGKLIAALAAVVDRGPARK